MAAAGLEVVLNGPDEEGGFVRLMDEVEATGKGSQNQRARREEGEMMISSLGESGQVRRGYF